MRLYVGNISWESSDDDLRDLFSKYGAVKSARIMLDRDTRKSRGFGFVEMEDTASARRAIAELHDQSFMGRLIVVNGARPRENNTNRRGG